MGNVLRKLRERICSLTLPTFSNFVKAKRIYEGSPNGAFLYYHQLTPEQFQAARTCPELGEAERLYRQCIETEAREGRLFNEGVTHHQLGLLLQRQERVEEAAEAYRRAIAILNSLPDADAPTTLSACEFRLAELALARGDCKAARQGFERSLATDRELDDAIGVRMNNEMLERVTETETRGNATS